MRDPYKNIASHPIPIDDGSIIPVGEIVKIDASGPIAQSYIDSGALTPVSKKKPSSGGGDE